MSVRGASHGSPPNPFRLRGPQPISIPKAPPRKADPEIPTASRAGNDASTPSRPPNTGHDSHSASSGNLKSLPPYSTPANRDGGLLDPTSQQKRSQVTDSTPTSSTHPPPNTKTSARIYGFQVLQPNRESLSPSVPADQTPAEVSDSPINVIALRLAVILISDIPKASARVQSAVSHLGFSPRARSARARSPNAEHASPSKRLRLSPPIADINKSKEVEVKTEVEETSLSETMSGTTPIEPEPAPFELPSNSLTSGTLFVPMRPECRRGAGISDAQVNRNRQEWREEVGKRFTTMGRIVDKMLIR
jgi:hypothetical protein